MRITLLSRKAPIRYAIRLCADLHLDIDAGSTCLALEQNDVLGVDVVSMHALLNDIFCAATLSAPPSAGLKRFFQRFLSLHPSSCSSLAQLEPLLFPSIFYHQLEDGSYPGTIPIFLYTIDKDCHDFSFHVSKAYSKSDPTLETSSNAKYIVCRLLWRLCQE